MRLFISLVLLAGGAFGAVQVPSFAVLSQDAGAWPEILSSIALPQRPAAVATILVARGGAADSAALATRVEQGNILILEGESALAGRFGFRPAGDRKVKVVSLRDSHRPELAIIWERPLQLPIFDVPAGAKVFAEDRASKAPMIAGMRRGHGSVLWVAAAPGDRGYERFPYLLQALCDLGVEPPLRSARLWAFFDSAYRLHVDPGYFAERWREAGIAALHVAAWHYYESNPESDGYLNRLIEACHRQGILVYAWLELPHVSEKFWEEHPEWREKTALLQDAQLDWRKLMNLANPDCFRAVSQGVRRLVTRFDWDGINLGELYFESLEGIGNPSRFTPMNGDARGLFQSRHGFDPLEVFNSRKDRESRKMFLDFRSDLAGRLQEEWIAELASIRREKPYLDLVLTQVDDRFDSSMRDAIGADAGRILPVLEKHGATLLIEDPATVWNLGPQRYGAIAERYRALTRHRDNLAIDLNIVDRYQDVYPTKQQTGVELLELVHHAVADFQRVALYFESSLLAPDWPLLAAASAGPATIEVEGARMAIHSVSGVGVRWSGDAEVDGHSWPVADDLTVWLPPGGHSVTGGGSAGGFHLVRLNGSLESARYVSETKIEFAYQSSARTIAIVDRVLGQVQIDGADSSLGIGRTEVMLPPGRHVVLLGRR